MGRGLIRGCISVFFFFKLCHTVFFPVTVFLMRALFLIAIDR